MYITLPRGSAADTSRIFEFWLLLFWMETWDWAGEERGDEELQELAPEEPRPSRILFLALPLLTWSQVWEA